MHGLDLISGWRRTSSFSQRRAWVRPKPGKAFLDAQTLYDGWQANYGSIESMRFALSVVNGLVDESGTAAYSNWQHWEKVEDGKCIYVRFSKHERGFANADSVVVNTFDGEVGKEYMPGCRQGSIYQGLKDRIQGIRNPMRACLDDGTVNMSSMRPDIAEDKRKLLEDLMKEFPDGIPVLTCHFMTSRQTGQIRVLPELESVAGQMCHVIEVGDSQSGWITEYWGRSRMAVP